jgi:hypothetical protein
MLTRPISPAEASAQKSLARSVRAMPRDGSMTLSDVRGPTLAIGCERCGRHGRYNVERLVAAHGADAQLTELLVTLANCEKARSLSIHDRCKAKFEGFRFRARGEGRALTVPSCTGIARASV